MITENQKPIDPELFELLYQIDQANDTEKVVELVEKYGKKYSYFTDYLRCAFDDTIEFLLPEGRPPYTPAHEAGAPTTWRKRHLDLGYFVKGMKADAMNPVKRETMFIGLLESIHPEDALHVSNLLSKKVEVSGLTKEVVQEALPGLLKK
jgi:hypothetical protein